MCRVAGMHWKVFFDCFQITPRIPGGDLCVRVCLCVNGLYSVEGLPAADAIVFCILCLRCSAVYRLKFGKYRVTP